MSAALKKERFEFRLDEAAKRQIEEAASLVKMTVSQFVADSARARAVDVISEHRRVVVESDKWDSIMQSLDNPPAPTERLKAAFDRYHSPEAWHCN
ncbi:MAG: DUF1778 domain-containing protein [Plesiomonas shigelloides]